VNLLKAEDPRKCQTFFLSQVSQEALQSALFPLGGMLKTDVKELARKAGLERIARRKEVTPLLDLNFDLTLNILHNSFKSLLYMNCLKLRWQKLKL